MTAQVLDLDPNAAAWHTAETNGMITEPAARQALIYAADQTVIDPEWLTEARWVVVHMRLLHAAVPGWDRRSRFEWLVVAVSSRFGPLIGSALDGCVRP